MPSILQRGNAILIPQTFQTQSTYQLFQENCHEHHPKLGDVPSFVFHLLSLTSSFTLLSVFFLFDSNKLSTFRLFFVFLLLSSSLLLISRKGTLIRAAITAGLISQAAATGLCVVIA